MGKEGGCSGCKQRSLSVAALTAFMEDAAGQPEDAKKRLKAVLDAYDRVGDGGRVPIKPLAEMCCFSSR